MHINIQKELEEEYKYDLQKYKKILDDAFDQRNAIEGDQLKLMQDMIMGKKPKE